MMHYGTQHDCQSCVKGFKSPIERRSKVHMYFKCLNCGTEKRYNRNTDNKYCSVKCQQAKRTELKLASWLSGKDPGWTGKTASLRYLVRRYMLEKHNNACVKCGWDKKHPIDGKPLVEINHIDGDAKNCNEDNLEVLCPNCHSETPNFRARNKTSSRER